MNEVIKAFLAASGGTVVGALLLYFALRLFDEPLKSLFHVAASKEIEEFKLRLGEQLESFKADLQRDMNVESLNRTKRITFLERQLSEFYWPLYWRLQKDNAVWEWILERDTDDEDRKHIARSIERDFILPNHEGAVRIIESKIHLAECDTETEELMLQYVRHVAVYQAMRKSEKLDDFDPIALDERWPKKLFPSIKKVSFELQQEYDKLIRENAA